MVIVSRSLRPYDNVAEIAKYIYQTDQYIYPFLYKNADDPEWINVISDNLTNPNSLFYYKNITVIIYDDKIIGLANIIRCGKKHTFLNNDLCNTDVYLNYFQPLIEEIENLSGYYLCNVCIDEEFRNKGIGHFLLKEVIRVNDGVIHTDAVADNTAAIKVYQDNGFEITKEYMGYSGEHPDGLKCVKLIKR